jgi:hypothetical protein
MGHDGCTLPVDEFGVIWSTPSPLDGRPVDGDTPWESRWSVLLPIPVDRQAAAVRADRQPLSQPRPSWSLPSRL